MLDEAHLPAAERAHDQRIRETAIEVQLRDKARQVVGAAGLLDEVDRRALTGAGGEVDGELGRELMAVHENVEQLTGNQRDHLLGNVRRDEVALDQTGLDDLVAAEAAERVVKGLVGPFCALVCGQGPDGFHRAVLGDDFGDRDRQRVAVGDGGLLGGGDGQHEFDEVLVRKHGRVLQDGDRDRFDIACEFQGHFARQDRRGAQRHRERAAHEVGRVFGEDGDDLLGVRLLGIGQHIQRDAAAQPVGDRGALLRGFAPHQAKDVVLSQLGPDALDRHGRAQSSDSEFGRTLGEAG